MKSLVIVESPTKAKTISRFVDSSKYQIESSFGHIRDLPKSKMGVDVEHDFKPEYVIPDDKSKTVTALKKSLAKIDTIILATDEDREGEAIAWHLLKALNLKDDIKVKRIVFHEITKEAIEEALANPRAINMKLVDAQQGRRVLDRLVGYELSPFLWKKVARGLSAGRVQSAAVRLIVEKEEEIRKFAKQEYWSVTSLLDTQTINQKPKVTIKKSDDKNSNNTDESLKIETKSKSQLLAKLYSKNDKVYAKLGITTQAQATGIAQYLASAEFSVVNIEKKEQRRSPKPPFTTSTLQQAANQRLGFSAKQTMYFAQGLYEGVSLGSQGSQGLITYMRTDSVTLSEKFLNESRTHIEKDFGKEHLPNSPNFYKTKSKGAQEAHEAVRPSQVSLAPESIKQYLNEKQYKLYELIWQRAVASQMKPAIFDATVIDIKADEYILRATGQTIKFAGFMKAYPTGSKETTLPEVKPDQTLYLEELLTSQHFTKPPARYSDATLVKILEELGIGRPSTYAPIISTIQSRNYVDKEGRYLKPTEMGEIVNKILVEHFPDIVDYNFTAKMEDELDDVATGDREWTPVIRDFYKPFKTNLRAKNDVISKKDLEEPTDEKCDKCSEPMMIKIGRFGKFMACTGYPECKNTKPLNGDGSSAPAEPKSLGKDPDTGKEVLVLTGRFGPYVQLGEKDDANPKPRRASLKNAKDSSNVELAEALKLLSLPKTLGEHPEKKQPVVANIGRFGPYVGCDGEYRSVKEPDDVYEITLERALELLAQEKTAGRSSKKTLKEVGPHPKTKKKINIYDGRYGPYIKYGTKNISLPKDLKDETKIKSLTMEDIVKIIDEAQ
jgi:DNA topoisomerase I